MNQCPICKENLDWKGAYFCTYCDQYFVKIAVCPDCTGNMEKLAACGALNYFCPKCNELKSKSRISFRFENR